MKTDDFSFDLPERLIAQYPPEKRGGGRLMVLDRGNHSLRHAMVEDLPDILDPAVIGSESLLVFNNSKVRKVRLIGVSEETGAAVEFLLVKKIDDYTWKAMVKRAKRRRPGSRYLFDGENSAEIVPVSDAAGNSPAGNFPAEFRMLRFEKPADDTWLEKWGHMPLPPYIKRQDTPLDGERYQTVYARFPGSAAAPTAGLHFTAEILRRLADKGIESAFVTLHVGLGTFLPVRAENIEDHGMHEESYSIDEENAAKIEKAKAAGRRIIAVGTTSVRTLETAWRVPAEGGLGGLCRGEGASSIFIYPGYRFNVVDSLFTNFHTPRSTLLMLVAAFAGRDVIQQSYAEAIRKGYHFFSYGDAMLIL
jgi:S-adenosylmethionine:tRNA ribosyltransferase-isomerase